jgi:hypothetical protein
VVLPVMVGGAAPLGKKTWTKLDDEPDDPYGMGA